MLQASQVEHSNATILTTTHKHVDAVGAKPDIVYLLVVSNQLRLGGQRRDIPDCASRVYTRGDYETRRNGIPVERCQGRSMIRSLGV